MKKRAEADTNVNKPAVKQPIHKNVILTGFTSFFTDVSSEMIYPLLQAFIAMIMAAQKAALGPILGIIEGIAESSASLLKVFSGYLSDRIKKRKIPVIVGYACSACAKIFFLLGSYGWYFVLLARFFDRVGKGVRAAPRDALISESTQPALQGRAFGFQRGMDFAGATLGAVICFFLVLQFLDVKTGNLKSFDSFSAVFLISLIPAFIGVIFLFFLKDKPKVSSGNSADKPLPDLAPDKYNTNLKWFFLSQFIFTLGNSSNLFLMLRSMDLHISLPLVVVMYLVFNLCSSVLSPFFGALSDRIGRKIVLLAGYCLYAVVYAAFGFITPGANLLLWVFWPVYGVYYALTEGVEKAFVAENAPAGAKATALGFYHMIVGIGLLPASIIAGVLFSIMPGLPFFTGGGFAFLSVLILLFLVKEKSADKT
ncbi:MAG: MFS transporter [Spirochaetales bacterium]|nr:MFS transporter [Spirochaetales bacterium]